MRPVSILWNFVNAEIKKEDPGNRKRLLPRCPAWKSEVYRSCSQRIHSSFRVKYLCSSEQEAKAGRLAAAPRTWIMSSCGPFSSHCRVGLAGSVTFVRWASWIYDLLAYKSSRPGQGRVLRQKFVALRHPVAGAARCATGGRPLLTCKKSADSDRGTKIVVSCLNPLLQPPASLDASPGACPGRLFLRLSNRKSFGCGSFIPRTAYKGLLRTHDVILSRESRG